MAFWLGKSLYHKGIVFDTNFLGHMKAIKFAGYDSMPCGELCIRLRSGKSLYRLRFGRHQVGSES